MNKRAEAASAYFGKLVSNILKVLIFWETIVQCFLIGQYRRNYDALSFQVHINSVTYLYRNCSLVLSFAQVLFIPWRKKCETP